MEKICLMINGLPGKVAYTMAAHAMTDTRFTLVPYSLTGQEIQEKCVTMDDLVVTLVKPDERETLIPAIQKKYPELMAVDYTHPTAVNGNALFYTQFNIPFVMGTTGGDRAFLEETVQNSKISAVIAPNMAKQIVGFQAMMAHGAQIFPGLFKGYKLTVQESHQQAKADTSGTAKAVVEYFNKMGTLFTENEIIKERNPAIQQEQWGIPKEHLNGHAWHTYRLTSPDGSTTFRFEHNVNGRNIYVQGTFDGVCFLKDKLKQDSLKQEGSLGTVYTMMDVLKQG